MKSGKCGCNANKSKGGCCHIESVVSVDDRGQIILPKEIRGKAGINPKDKLALVLIEKENSVCCISLFKTEYLSDAVRNMLNQTNIEK